MGTKFRFEYLGWPGHHDLDAHTEEGLCQVSHVVWLLTHSRTLYRCQNIFKQYIIYLHIFVQNRGPASGMINQ